MYLRRPKPANSETKRVKGSDGLTDKKMTRETLKKVNSKNRSYDSSSSDEEDDKKRTYKAEEIVKKIVEKEKTSKTSLNQAGKLTKSMSLDNDTTVKAKSEKMTENNKKHAERIMAYVEKMKKQNEAKEELKKLEMLNKDETSSDSDIENIDNSNKTVIVEDDESESGNLTDKKPRREYYYECIERDVHLERQIRKICKINHLTPEQISYMVKRDINYYLDICSSQIESWRHLEYKKKTKKSSDLLHCYSAMTSYSEDQYMSAVKALQFIFCKKDFKHSDYIAKVLLPEALIKICMQVYQCSKDSAEEFLERNNHENKFELYPRGSAIYSPADSTKRVKKESFKK